jgi:hypothetical protein
MGAAHWPTSFEASQAAYRALAGTPPRARPTPALATTSRQALTLLDTVRLLYPVDVRLDRGFVYGLERIRKLATKMIGEYFVLDEMLEPCKQRRLWRETGAEPVCRKIR